MTAKETNTPGKVVGYRYITNIVLVEIGCDPLAVCYPRPKSTKGINLKPKTYIQHPSLGLIGFSCWVERGPRKPPCMCLVPAVPPGLITGVAGRRMVNRLLCWVSFRQSGYGRIRGFAFSANLVNSEKFFSHRHHNNDDHSLAVSKWRRLRRFWESPMMLRCTCATQQGGKVRSEILSRAGIFPWVVWSCGVTYRLWGGCESEWTMDESGLETG